MGKGRSDLRMANKASKIEQHNDLSPIEAEHDDIPAEMAEVLNELSEPQRKEVTRIMSAGFSMISRTSPEGEIAKKITPDHISAMLNAQEKGMDYTFKENQNKMVFFVIILVIVVGAVITIIALLKDSNPDAMEQILIALISAALGAAGGYGIGVKKRDDN